VVVLRGGDVTMVVVWLLRFPHHRISRSSVGCLGLLAVALFFPATVDGAAARLLDLLCL